MLSGGSAVADVYNIYYCSYRYSAETVACVEVNASAGAGAGAGEVTDATATAAAAASRLLI